MFIKVKVFADWGREEVVKKSSDSFEIRVKEKPIGGMANRRVTKIISLIFKVPEGRVRLIKGAREPGKIFKILD
jgi:uncharacterized protein YggU (UPF0235/DUF167 family)